MRAHASDATSWLEMGPAEFDRKRLPRGHKPAPAEQNALFFAAIPPAPVKAPQRSELDGQEAMFGEDDRA